MKANTFLLRASIYAVIVVCLVVGVNYLADPYGITGAPRIPGLNEHKVEINEHTRVMKKYHPLLSSYNALVVGNSRVELGIDPSHPCFRSNGLDVYNLGIPGAGVSTQLAYALNLVYQQPIDTVFLSLDFTDFISTDRRPHHSGFSSIVQAGGELRFMGSGEQNPDYRQVVFLDYLKSLFSLDALVASVRTLVLQSSTSADRDAAGFNPGRDFVEAVKVEGPRALFDQKMAGLRYKYSRPWYIRDSEGDLNPVFTQLDTFLDIAEARGITVYLFTNPFHQQFWDLLRAQGHMSAYAQWMQSIENIARAHPDTSIVLWDFSKDSPYIHESVPVAGAPLQWFWEPAHYRKELGDLMVDAMLSKQCDTDVAFGRQVF